MRPCWLWVFASLIATHNFELAVRMDRALLLHQGKLVSGTDLARA